LVPRHKRGRERHCDSERKIKRPVAICFSKKRICILVFLYSLWEKSLLCDTEIYVY